MTFVICIIIFARKLTKLTLLKYLDLWKAGHTREPCWTRKKEKKMAELKHTKPSLSRNYNFEFRKEEKQKIWKEGIEPKLIKSSLPLNGI